tara:strand:- start:818 stop:964 length:147 start_codon:yes stop_codon:yes gene_type:complete
MQHPTRIPSINKDIHKDIVAMQVALGEQQDDFPFSIFLNFFSNLIFYF